MTDSSLIADMIRAGVDPDIVQRVAMALIEAQGAAQVAILKDESAERRRAADRERKAESRALVRRNPQTSTESADKSDPSPSLSFPPAPPLSPSPTPPSPHAPTPTHPHPPTPVREAGAVLALDVEIQPKPDRFDEFWKLYPRREAKADALKAWKKINAADHPAIFAAIPTHIASQAWQKEACRFIPLPASWLNACRWEDELKAATNSDVRPAQQDYEEPGFLTDPDAIFHKKTA